jgi:hypothetical protein
LPFKLNHDHRHHIPKQKRKVTNWRDYDASLRQRGSLTVWFTSEAIEGWRAAPRATQGGQSWYSPLAILTALTLRTVFRLALRQTEGLIGSVIGLLGLTLRVPDHSTLSRRAVTLDVPRRRGSASARMASPCTCWWTARGFCNGATGVKSLVRCLATGFWLLSVVGPEAAHTMRSEGAGASVVQGTGR